MLFSNENFYIYFNTIRDCYEGNLLMHECGCTKCFCLRTSLEIPTTYWRTLHPSLILWCKNAVMVMMQVVAKTPKVRRYFSFFGSNFWLNNFNIMFCLVQYCYFPFSALALLVGGQEGHPACKNCVSVCWWWHFDWSFARLIAFIVTTTSILSSNKIHNGDVLLPANPDSPGKWPLKWRERFQYCCQICAIFYQCNHLWVNLSLGGECAYEPASNEA